MNRFRLLFLAACLSQTMLAKAEGVVDIPTLFAADSKPNISDEFIEDESEYCSKMRSVYGLTKVGRAEHISALQEGECAITYKVGDLGPAGGRVFHTTEDGIHGLESAPNDIQELEWGCHSIQIDDASGVKIGDGKSNTEILVTLNCTSVSWWGGRTVVDAVQNHEVNGFSDWLIPSRDEMIHMYTVLTSKGVGNFANTLYWISTVSPDFGSKWTLMLNGGNGSLLWGERSIRKPVRPIRSF